MVSYFASHWPAWLGVAISAVVAWIAAHWVGSPLLRFLSDRRDVIEAVQEHGSRDYFLSAEEDVRAARGALLTAAPRMYFYAQGGPSIVRIYCNLRGYDLHAVGRVLNGLVNRVGSPVPVGTDYQAMRREFV